MRAQSKQALQAQIALLRDYLRDLQADVKFTTAQLFRAEKELDRLHKEDLGEK